MMINEEDEEDDDQTSLKFRQTNKYTVPAATAPPAPAVLTSPRPPPPAQARAEWGPQVAIGMVTGRSAATRPQKDAPPVWSTRSAGVPIVTFLAGVDSVYTSRAGSQLSPKSAVRLRDDER